MTALSLVHPDLPQRLRRISILRSLQLGLLSVGVFLMPCKACELSSSVSYSDLALLMAAALWFIEGMLRPRTLFLPGFLVLGACLLLLSNSLASMFLHQPDMGWGRLIKLLIASVLLPVIFAWVSPGPLWVRRLLWVFVAGCCLSVIAGVAHARGINIGINRLATDDWGRMAGLGEHPIIFAIFCALAIPMCWVFAFQPKNPLELGGALLAVALLFYGINASGSRAGLGGALLGTLCVLWLSRRSLLHKAQSLRLAAMAVLVLVAGGAGLTANIDTGKSAIDRFFGTEYSVVADTERRHQQQRALAQFEFSPLFGTSYFWLTEGHNVVLQFLACGGVLGLLGYGLILGGYGWTVFSLRQSSRLNAEQYQILTALLAAMVALLGVDMFQPVVQERGAYIAPALILAMARWHGKPMRNRP
jgi:hypothetical protein